MKQLLLATALIALPAAGFAAVETWLVGETTAAADTGQARSLGDLSAYETIVKDSMKLVDAGDLAAAETRITDFETMWDEAEAALRPEAPGAWGNIDAAADAAFAALRARAPSATDVKGALAALSSTLADPAGGAAERGGARSVSGVAVTDANGHPIPCESMLADLRAALADGSIAAADAAKAGGLQAKAMERCNADDDARADSFAAEALALRAR